MRELTTPTGALLIGQLAAVPGPMPPMVVRAVGYGGGSMNVESGPNVLRVLLGDPIRPRPADEGRRRLGENVVELATNLDDISPEVVAHACRLLREAGALDVWTVFAQGKKDRPLMVLHLLCTADREEEFIDIVFDQTGTLGIRRLPVSRYVAERGHVAVQVAGHSLRVKWGRWGGRLLSVAPEYEDAVAAADASGMTLLEIMATARGQAAGMLQAGVGSCDDPQGAGIHE